MMKKWKKLMAAVCTASMLITILGMSVLADGMAEEELIITEIEDPGEMLKPADSLSEDVTDDTYMQEVKTISSNESVEVVGEGPVQVGDGVTAMFDRLTGAVEFTSQDGELWPNWVDKLGVDKNRIKSIKVASGTVHLPADISRLFSGCSSLKSLDLSNFDSSNVTDMTYMFEYCGNLTNLDLSNFDTSNVTDMCYMFFNCRSLTNLDLSSFNTSNVTDMNNMFYYCSNLTELDLSGFNTSNVTDMNNMFYYCSNLTELDLSNFNTSDVWYMNSMFSSCSRLAKLDLSSFDTSNVTDMSSMFSSCNNLTKLDLSSFNTLNVTDMSGMFSGCSSLTNLDLSSFNTSNVSDMSHMFSGPRSLTNLDLSNFDTSNVTDMSYMFYGCSNLTDLELSSFRTSNVTSMSRMFEYCYKLASLDLSSFSTSNVASMSNMFDNCKSLTKLDLCNFDTSNVTNMEWMFLGCAGLTNMDLSGFNTLKVTKMSYMFEDCSNLTVLDLSNFDTSKVVDFSHMFNNCTNLQILKTPQKNILSILLPTTMYDESGNEYSELPDLSESILLTRTNPVQLVDISNCSVNLSSINYTFSGSAKEPTVTVMDGSTLLEIGTDYSVCYADNTDAGTANVKVVGIGNYKGEKNVTFTINKADAKLLFTEERVSKKTTDAAFTNDFSKATDEVETFASSNTKVAEVDSVSGLVTIKGAGTATITAVTSEGKNYKAGSTSYILTVEAPTPTPSPAASGFSDVQDLSHPYYNAIYWAAEAGITKGYADGTFGVNKSCTRGEMMMFLWRYAGKPSPKAVSKSPFKDVPMNHVFYKAILWGSQKGITKGYPDGSFGINKNVSRGECMMFLWRLKGKPAPKNVSKSPFKDVLTSQAFYKAILWGSQKGITKGYTSGPKKGNFGINDNCTRGQIVTFLYRA